MKLIHRLLIQTLAIVVVLVASVVLIIDNRLHKRIVDETTLELAREARLVATQWKSGIDPDQLADVSGAATGHRVTLIGPDGKVIGDTDFNGPALNALQNHSSRPEVVGARKNGVGSSLRVSPSTGEEQLYVAVAAPLGVARVSVTTQAVEQIFDAARRDVLVAGFLSLLLAAVISVLFARSVSRPIVELRDVARSLADGNLDARPALAAPGEVGDLADALHRLGEQLGSRLLALELEQSRLSALINSLNEGVVAIGADQQVARISAPAREMLGISHPTPFSLDFLPRDASLRDAIAEALSGVGTGPVEMISGNRTLSLNVRPLRQGGAVVALYDLTPAKQLENVRRDFVANVSHELRTPLTVIGGFAETLADPTVPPERAVDFAKSILAHTKRMQRLVDDLLDLSRIESGGWSPKPETVNVSALLSGVGSSSSLVRDKGLEFRADISPDAETIWADRTALSQIIFNLVENAVRHTQKGSITVGSRRDGSGVELRVEDTGAGIAAEHLPRIFERFYRADTGRARETGGTGLGLAIVKHLVEAHGGHVEASSVVDKGTVMRVFFPDGAPPAAS